MRLRVWEKDDVDGEYSYELENVSSWFIGTRFLQVWYQDGHSFATILDDIDSIQDLKDE